MGSCCITQEAQLSALRQPRGVGWGWGMGGRFRGRGRVCTYGWLTLLCGRNTIQHHKAVILQLKMNFKKWIIFCINLTLCCNSKCWHEYIVFQQELIYFTFSRQGSGEHTVNLSLLLQRCNEVQLWVATEILLCSPLGKRVQLVKKFIKIAAQWVSSGKKNAILFLSLRGNLFFPWDEMGWDVKRWDTKG